MIFIIGLGSHADMIANMLDDEYVKIDYNNIENIDLDNKKVIIGIGDNKLRYDIYQKLKIKNIEWINIISKNAYIGKNVNIGFGNVIIHGVVINNNVKIGNHNIINTQSSIDHDSIIKSFIHIAPHTCICGNVKINDLVFIGSNSTIIPKVIISPYEYIKANSLIKENKGFIPITNIDIDKYKISALNAIESSWISNHGQYIEKAEKLLKEYLNVKYAILMSNGTCATHCLFISLKHKYPNIKKIYVPNNVYVAAWNSLLMVYNKSIIEVMPIDIYTWNIDVSEKYIKSLDNNSAIFIVHNLGNIINVPRLKRLREDIIFIEDNCEGFTGEYEDKKSGTESLCSSISFYGNKIITTGEGGAFITNDEYIYNYIKRIYSQGNTSIRYLHDILGYNYRMTNIQAGFLYDQLLDINNIILKRKNVFENYDKLIKNNNLIKQFEEENTKRAYWMYAIRITNASYNKISSYMNEFGIETRPFFYPINSHEHLKDIRNDDINSIILNKEIIIIPTYININLNIQGYIIEKLNEYMYKYFVR